MIEYIIHRLTSGLWFIINSYDPNHHQLSWSELDRLVAGPTTLMIMAEYCLDF